uniref:Uncharacterized protein n=1 Tax=Lepeophtheirus salmonis TaxID=72036 RepID=A0A0K2UEJ7_LEPSM
MTLVMISQVMLLLISFTTLCTFKIPSLFVYKEFMSLHDTFSNKKFVAQITFKFLFRLRSYFGLASLMHFLYMRLDT